MNRALLGCLAALLAAVWWTQGGFAIGGKVVRSVASVAASQAPPLPLVAPSGVAPIAAAATAAPQEDRVDVETTIGSKRRAAGLREPDVQGARSSAAGGGESIPDEEAPPWVTRKPPPDVQVEMPKSDRGFNPCAVPDPGFGAYRDWDRSTSPGQVLVPHQPKLDSQGRFAVMFHFHGHESVRKEWVSVVSDAVLYAVDLGINSGPYIRAFTEPAAFDRLLQLVERRVGERLGKPVSAGPIGLSAWSAGYGAVQRILESTSGPRIDSVILIDGLHTSSVDTERARRALFPFVRHARRAVKSEALMYVSHSSIVPPSYASTTETANYLVWQLGGRVTNVNVPTAEANELKLIRHFSDGGFVVRGFAGNGKRAHCAQMAEYQRALRHHVAPRWGLSTLPEKKRP